MQQFVIPSHEKHIKVALLKLELNTNTFIIKMYDLLCLLILTFIINTKNFCNKKMAKNGKRNKSPYPSHKTKTSY